MDEEPDPGDRSKDPEPHHALNNPVGEPDPTEYPDPYEQREDPRDPEDSNVFPGSRSTSEPHPSEDLEAEPSVPPERDNLDD